jgi:hypothetical protein
MSEEDKKRQRRKEYQREYNCKYKEEVARKKREYRLRNIEHFKALDKKRYYEKRDEILKYKREHDNRPRKGYYRDWRPIIQRVKKELADYKKLEIIPTLRTMFYRLYSLNIIHGTRGRLSRFKSKNHSSQRI